MPTNIDAIEAAMKLLDRELWVVTARDGARRGGLLATWVSPVSIDRERPVLLAGIAPNHYTSELIDGSGAVGLHLLRRDQAALALNFAIGSGRDRDKFAGIDLRASEGAAPLLQDCLAWFEGQVFARLVTGDRILYWIDVLAAGQTSQEPAAREHDLFAAATPGQKGELLANRDADIRVQRPCHDAWRAQLPLHLRPQ